MIDTHAHLNVEQFEKDSLDIINSLNSDGIETLMCIGNNHKDSLVAMKMSQEHAHIFCSLGMSPHEAGDLTPEIIDEYQSILSDPRSKNYIRAIGETGLDYHYNFASKESQIKSFRNQIGLANKFHLPVIIHCREAYDDVLKILKTEKPEKAVIHCFDGSLEFGKEIIAMGYMISLTGIITYPGRKELRNTIKKLPIEHMMLETDCPYLPPQSKRGKRNEPKFIMETAEKLAEIKDLTFAEIDKITSENAIKFFFK
jgi:TatD DNase family protein